ncbi:hypothetical protein BCV71DRAFT_253414 [Rhizopus microsporus]|uniref:Uncharacterized protein n=1 Tax=Rhizopus microsporus TaxID=58291 RepID=A0A1X0SBW9_RHIZD|nr:hypothetical protein BCV71DRAFT_253414 [Rhizopus microsporus]
MNKTIHDQHATIVKNKREFNDSDPIGVIGHRGSLMFLVIKCYKNINFIEKYYAKL